MDPHRLGKVLRLGARRRDAGGNGFAHISHLLRGQRRIARNLEAGHLRHRAHLGEARKVTRGEDASAGIGRDHDTPDARVGVRAADEGHVLRMGKLYVGNELPAPAQVARVLLAQKRRADVRGGVRDGARHAVVFWSVAPANAARSRTFQACTDALSTRSVGTRLLDLARTWLWTWLASDARCAITRSRRPRRVFPHGRR